MAIFKVKIYFRGIRGYDWVITYKCETADVYLARDVIVKRFLEDYYDDFSMITDVVVHKSIDGMICPLHFDIDIEEYDNAYIYHNKFFEEIMAESHIENLGIVEDDYGRMD